MESIARDCADKLKRYMVENDRVKIQGAYDAASTATEIAVKMHGAQGALQVQQEKMNKFTKVLVDKVLLFLIRQSGSQGAAIACVRVHHPHTDFAHRFSFVVKKSLWIADDPAYWINNFAMRLGQIKQLIREGVRHSNQLLL